MRDLTDLIEAADLNGLLRAVDALCADRAWDDLVDLAERCEDAVERGKQLWPIAAHVDYRLALEAPGDYAASVLESDLGRFALGPLTEVAASSHKWDELAPHIESSQSAAYVAQERVLRGENLTGDDRAHGDVLELPLVLQPWEPTYALATYRSDHVEVAEPWDPKTPLTARPVAPATEVDDPEITNTLLDLVQPWTVESNGAARAVVVDGDALSAASMIAFDELRAAPLTPEEALRLIGWAAASGGAHGKRRGATLGRSLAWFTATVLTGMQWPPDPDALGRGVAQLEWLRWDEGAPEKGWVLRLAIGHPDGWGAAIAATDLLTDNDEDDEGNVD